MPTALPLAEPATVAVCCAPGTEAVISDDDAQSLARIFKALSDPTRVKLLSMTAAADDGACICDMTAPVGLSQPTVSHHMKLLAEAGLVAREQRGKWAHYRVVPDALQALAATLAPAAR